MNHPEKGTLRGYADGELDGTEGARVENHLEDCPECATEVESFRDRARVISDALLLVDTAPPVRRARETVARRVRGSVDLPGSAGGRRLARAAAVTLVVIVGGVGLVSAAPVRGFVLDVWERVRSRPQQEEPIAPPDQIDLLPLNEEPTPSAPETHEEVGPPEPTPPLALDAGVHLDASSQPVQIVLHGPASGLQVQVDLVDGTTASVFGTVESRFRRAAGRIEAVVEGSTVRVEVPRSAEDLVVIVNGETWLLKDGPELQLRGPVLERTDETVRFGTVGG